jgi:hypothetical protein
VKGKMKRYRENEQYGIKGKNIWTKELGIIRREEKNCWEGMEESRKKGNFKGKLKVPII